MPIRTLLAAAALLTLAAAVHAGHDGTDWGQAEIRQVVAGAQFPADIAIAADGTVWAIEVYTGDVLNVPPGGEVQVVHHVDSVSEQDERGLVGLALSPDHAETGAYYLYYTAPNEEPDGGTNKIVRIQDGSETVLATVPGKDEHNGGRMAFDAEGHLWVTTGENQLRDPAQDEDSLLGKVLRMTSEGEPVEGNLKGLVYSKGHRNVYGLAIDPASGEVWVTENSGWRRDEVNRVEAGGNYGYPECEGRGLNGVDTPCPTDKGYTFPVMSFYEDRAAAPTGAAFWNGGFYWASLREGSIHHIWEQDGTWRDEIVHERGPAEAVLDVEAGPDGRLWFSTVDGIYQVRFPGDGGPTDDPATSAPVTRDPEAPTGGIDPPGPAEAPGAALLPVVLLVVGLGLLRRR